MSVDDEINRLRDRMHDLANDLMKLGGEVSKHIAVCGERDLNSERRMARMENLGWTIMFSSACTLIATLAGIAWYFFTRSLK